MDNDKIENYNKHAKFLAEIAEYILDGNTEKLKENNGIKELISFYLLIPYMTKSQLDTPDEGCRIPQITKTIGKTDTGKDISLSSLRDSMCHSFVTIDGNNNDGSNCITFDDRASCKDKGEHDKLETKGGTCKIKIDEAHKLLSELIQEIKKQ